MDYIVQRRMKLQKLRRQARRVEIAVIRTYKLIRFLFALLIIFGIYKICTSNLWILPQDIYTNQNTPALEILGNSIVKNDKIINEMKKIELGDKPLYKINPDKITKNIESLQPVRRAYVRRFWFPARLVVMVEEVAPVFIIAPTEESPAVAAYALTGELIPKEYLPLDSKFRTTRILSYGTQGDDYTKWDKDKITLLYKIYRLIKEYSKEEVLYIDLRQPNNVFVQIESVKIRLGLLDSTVTERIKAIYDILPKIKTMNKKIQYVDLSWRESKYIKLDK